VVVGQSLCGIVKHTAAADLRLTTPIPVTQDDEINSATTIFNTIPSLRTTNTPCNIRQQALYNVIGQHLECSHLPLYTPKQLTPNTLPSNDAADTEFSHCANGVVHPITKETITKYKKLANDPITKEVWTKAMSKELGRLAQGFDGTKGTETIFFMTHDEITNIPKDRTVTYARIVVDYRPQKQLEAT
jgi:hypothetical protein